MSQRSLPCKLYDEIGLGLLMLAWRFFFFFFFCLRTTSARKLRAWKLRTTISKPNSRLWRETKHVFALQALGQGVRGSAFNESPNQAPQPWSWPKQLHVSRTHGVRPFQISGDVMPILIFGHMAPPSCVRKKLTRPVHGAHEDPNGGKEQIGLHRSPAPTSECMQMNRCQGLKSKPIGAVKSALSHGDGDKRFSKPLDFAPL